MEAPRTNPNPSILTHLPISPDAGLTLVTAIRTYS